MNALIVLLSVTSVAFLYSTLHLFIRMDFYRKMFRVENKENLRYLKMAQHYKELHERDERILKKFYGK